jgi:uncharacterized protein (DUF1800 family)
LSCPAREETEQARRTRIGLVLQGVRVAGDDRSLIAHLFRRAGFGARPAELDYYVAAGYDAAVTDLVSATSIAGSDRSYREVIDPLDAPARNLIGRALVSQLADIQIEWILTMVTTSTPLVERMTLFLHDHFATAYTPGDVIDSPELIAQNKLFRRFALGNFKTLLHAMLEDVALSRWLDNDSNIVDAPNENLARELMELFTLGPGNYTETDVREVARALTGYQMSYNLDVRGPRNHMIFNAALHDVESKSFLGRTGNFMPHEVIEIVLDQPAAPTFLARKLAETFISPVPSQGVVASLASTLSASEWELAPVLRAIFTSPEFMAEASWSSIVKTPAEFMVGAMRALGRADNGDAQAAVAWMRRAGQALYDPPNVGGWPHNEGWLGAGQMLARYNFSAKLADLHQSALVLPPATKTRADTVAGWAEVFGMTQLSSATAAALADYLADTADRTPAERDAGMITLVMASPEFSLA